MSRIGTTPPDFTLPKYQYVVDPDGINVNDGSDLSFNAALRSAASAAGDVILIYFINVQTAVMGGPWMAQFHDIASEAGIRPLAVCFRHDGSAYVSLDSDIPIFNAIANAGLADDDFSTIPIFRDSNGSTSDAWLGNISGDSHNYGGTGTFFGDAINSDHQMWAYIIDTNEKVSDKWHANRSTDATALTKILPGFPAGDAAGTVKTRCLNLRTALKILTDAVVPLESSVLSAFPVDPIQIAFSRPLNAASAVTPGNWTLGGDAVSAGAGTAVTADYVGRNFIENTVSPGFSPTAALNDSGGWNMDISFPSLTDDSGGAPAAGEDSLSWIVSTAVPSISSAVLTNPPAVVSGSTVGVSPILVNIMFSEPLQSQPGDLVQIIDNSVPVNPPTNIALTHTGGNAAASLSFQVTDSTLDGAYQLTVPAAALEDAGGDVSASTWNMDIVYDAAPPQALISMDVPAGSSVSSHEVSVSVDFGENVTGVPDTASTPGISTDSGTLTYLGAGVSPGEFLYTLALDTPGPVSVSVAAGAVTDIPLGRDSLASAAYAFSYAPTFKNVVLVVDTSGSMNWDIPFDSGSGPVTTEKWVVMRPRIETLLARMNVAVGAGTVNGSEDKLSLITYNGAAQQVDLAGSDWIEADLVGDSVSPGPMDTSISTIIPSGSTAMGSAIAMAHTLLDSATTAADRDGAIILFADGQSNAGLDIFVSPGVDEFTIGDPAQLTVTLDGDNYPVYAVGIHTELASADDWLTTLQNIALISGGIYRDVTEVDTFPDAEDGLSEIMTAIYGGNTPVRVKSISSLIPAGENSVRIPFIMDSGATGIQLSLSWPGTERAGLTLENDGITLRQFRRALEAPQHSIVSTRFPHIQVSSFRSGFVGNWTLLRFLHDFGRPGYRPVRSVVEADGSWQVTVRRRGRKNSRILPFFLTVFAEESAAVPEVRLPPAPFETEKRFETTVVIKGNGLKISDAFMTLHYSPVPMANLVSEKAKRWPGYPISFRPDIVRGPELRKERAKKIALHEFIVAREKHILALPEVRMALRSRTEECYQATENRVIPGGRLCRWKLPGFPFPGHYRLMFTIKGRAGKTGSFERIVTRSVMVLPSINLDKSLISYKMNERTRWFEALVIPQDSAGNLLGPGFAGMIQSFDHVKGSFCVTDMTDGSYRVSGRRLKIEPGRTPKLGLRFGRGV